MNIHQNDKAKKRGKNAFWRLNDTADGTDMLIFPFWNDVGWTEM